MYGTEFDKYAIIQWHDISQDIKTEKDDAL